MVRLINSMTISSTVNIYGATAQLSMLSEKGRSFYFTVDDIQDRMTLHNANMPKQNEAILEGCKNDNF